MRRWLPYGMALLLFFLLSVVAHLPAWLIGQQQPQLRALGIQGSLWHGQMAQISLPVLPELQRVGGVSWQLQPWRTLIGRPELAFQLSGDVGPLAGQGLVAWRWGQVSGHDLMVSSQVRAWQRYWQAYGVELLGDVTLGVQHVSLQGLDCADLKGQLIWTDPQLNTPMGSLQPGDLLVTLRCDGPRYRADLVHQSDSVNAELSATIRADGQYQLSGWIQPQVNMAKGLRNALGWIAKGDSQGRYQLALQGQL